MAKKNKAVEIVALCLTLVGVVLVLVSFFVPFTVLTDFKGDATTSDFQSFLPSESPAVVYLFLFLPLVGTGLSFFRGRGLASLGTLLPLASLLYAVYATIPLFEPYAHPETLPAESTYMVGPGPFLLMAAFLLFFGAGLALLISSFTKKEAKAE